MKEERVRVTITAAAAICLIVFAAPPAVAQQCDDAAFSAEFNQRFGPEKQAGLDKCGVIALQLEALTYMKGVQRACFSGADLDALLADADRTIAQSEQSFRDSFCGDPPRFGERLVGGGGAAGSGSPNKYRLGSYKVGALTPCPSFWQHNCAQYADVQRKMRLGYEFFTIKVMENQAKYDAERGISMEESLRSWFKTCQGVDQWAPDLWETSGCSNYEQIIREGYAKQAKAEPEPVAPAAATATGPKRLMVIEKDTFTSWVTVDYPELGFLIHVQNRTDKRIKCVLKYEYTEQDVSLGNSIKERPRKDRRTMYVGPGNEEYYGLTVAGLQTQLYPRIDRYSIRCT